MSGKAKMRCARCHKPFRAASARQTLCAECEAKERRARAATKTTSATPTATAPAAKPKIVGPGANILVPGLVPPSPPSVAQVPAPHVTPPPRDERSGQRYPEHPGNAGERPRETGHPAGQTGQSYPGARPQHAGQGGHYAGHAPQGRAQSRQQPRPGQPRPPAPVPARPKREPAPVLTLTPELRERIEVRYRELAQPVEFDGIRTRIATELAVPKTLVKKAVLELRKRDQMPSWWELQGYHGSDEELARIRAAYAPLLPLPAVGVHKQIAEDLALDPGAVYQAIRRIRAEMHLPQYNPPESHEAESPQAEAAGQDGTATQAADSGHAPAHATATATATAAASPTGAEATDASAG